MDCSDRRSELARTECTFVSHVHQFANIIEMKSGISKNKDLHVPFLLNYQNRDVLITNLLTGVDAQGGQVHDTGGFHESNGIVVPGATQMIEAELMGQQQGVYTRFEDVKSDIHAGHQMADRIEEASEISPRPLNLDDQPDSLHSAKSRLK